MCRRASPLHLKRTAVECSARCSAGIPPRPGRGQAHGWLRTCKHFRGSSSTSVSSSVPSRHACGRQQPTLRLFAGACARQQPTLYAACSRVSKEQQTLTIYALLRPRNALRTAQRRLGQQRASHRLDPRRNFATHTVPRLSVVNALVQTFTGFTWGSVKFRSCLCMTKF